MLEEKDLPEVTPAEDTQQERKRPGVERIYSNDQIAVSWEPKLCIHIGACFRNSPSVFKPLKRPWWMWTRPPLKRSQPPL